MPSVTCKLLCSIVTLLTTVSWLAGLSSIKWHCPSAYRLQRFLGISECIARLSNLTKTPCSMFHLLCVTYNNMQLAELLTTVTDISVNCALNPITLNKSFGVLQCLKRDTMEYFSFFACYKMENTGKWVLTHKAFIGSIRFQCRSFNSELRLYRRKAYRRKLAQVLRWIAIDLYLYFHWADDNHCSGWRESHIHCGLQAVSLSTCIRGIIQAQWVANHIRHDAAWINCFATGSVSHYRIMSHYWIVISNCTMTVIRKLMVYVLITALKKGITVAATGKTGFAGFLRLAFIHSRDDEAAQNSKAYNVQLK